MNNFYEGQVIGIPVDSSNSRSITAIKERRSFGFSWMNMLRKRLNNLHKVRRGGKHENLSETLKGKLHLNKRTHQSSRAERLFSNLFSVEKEERLIKVCKCYFSTTAGAIKGTLFISTKKVAFYADESIRVTSPKGKIVAVPYKVLIPVKKVKKTIPTENAQNPDEKYLQIITVDNFEFWFMGFNHQNSFDCQEKTFSKIQ